jgi:hypothetical protein
MYDDKYIDVIKKWTPTEDDYKRIYIKAMKEYLNKSKIGGK